MLSNFYKLSFVVTFAFIAVASIDMKVNQQGSFSFGPKQVLADDGGGGGDGGGDGGTGGCCGGGEQHR